MAHPSLVSVPVDIQTIKKPGIYLCAEEDQQFPENYRKQTQEILQKNGIKSEFRFYPGTKHGFAVKGNDKNKVVLEARKNALEEAIKFFSTELKV